MATVTWAVKPDSLLTTTKNGNADFVVQAEYIITGTDGVNTVTIPYSHAFEAPGDTFTPFESLSEAQVISWAQEKLGAGQLANLQMGIERQLERMANPPPPIVTKSAPWGG